MISRVTDQKLKNRVRMAILKTKPYACIVLIGPPAMGKGTAGLYLSERYGAPVVTPGNVYSRLREEDSDLGNQVRTALKDGGLCPDWMTNDLVARSVSEVGGAAILDGYPRSLAQLDYLQAHYDVGGYLHIESAYELGLEASASRRQCPQCARVFTTRVPETACGCTLPEHWKVRWDDTPALYRKRFDTYNAQSLPVVDRIKGLENYLRVDLLAEGWPTFEHLLETQFTSFFERKSSVGHEGVANGACACREL